VITCDGVIALGDGGCVLVGTFHGVQDGSFKVVTDGLVEGVEHLRVEKAT